MNGKYMRLFSSKNKIDFIIAAICFLILLPIFFGTLFLHYHGLYRDGLNGSPSLDGCLSLFLTSFLVGIPFFVALIIRLIIRLKKDQVNLSVARFVLGVLLLIAPPLVCIASLEVAIRIEPGCVRFSKGFRDRIDSRCTPEEIRAWAQPILEKSTGKYIHYELTGDRVPHFVRKIYPNSSLGERARIFIDNGIIKVYWGSPLPGHWGLAICPKDMVHEEDFIEEKAEKTFYLKWKQGIYIWYGD
jgi:hypothetical protein